MDVFALGRLDGSALVFALFVRDGKVVGTEKFRMGADAGETDEEILAAFLKQYYLEDAAPPPEILLHGEAADMDAIAAWLSERAGRRVLLHRPQRGAKAKLSEMAYRNCIDALEKDAALQRRAWERGEGALAELSGLLGLESVPERLECFDNSHIQGRDTVSSMVVFTNGQPDRKAYRRFRIRAEAGGDDLVAMREALTRRFARFASGDAGFDRLPDLLVIDGGRTQLDVALEVLAEAGLPFVPAIGLAEAHELVYHYTYIYSLALPRSSAALHLLERLRDEAHRLRHHLPPQPAAEERALLRARPDRRHRRAAQARPVRRVRHARRNEGRHRGAARRRTGDDPAGRRGGLRPLPSGGRAARAIGATRRAAWCETVGRTGARKAGGMT